MQKKFKLKFNGNYLEFLFLFLVFSIISIISLGILFPLLICYLCNFIINNTEIIETNEEDNKCGLARFEKSI